MTDHEPVRKSRYLKIARTGLIYLLIFIVAGFAGNLWMSRNQSTGPAPGMVAQDLEGQWRNISLENNDGPLLLYFFADWCPICKVQHAVIESVSQDYRVLAIAMQSGSLENVVNYVQQAGLEFPVLNDARGAISRSYGVYGVPASFVIDRSGQIRFSTRGYATGIGLRLRLWLANQGGSSQKNEQNVN